MNTSEVASALGLSGISAFVLFLVVFLLKRGWRSRCIVGGVSVDIHRATSAEIAQEDNAAPTLHTQAQTQPQRDSVVHVNINATPVATPQVTVRTHETNETHDEM